MADYGAPDAPPVPPTTNQLRVLVQMAQGLPKSDGIDWPVAIGQVVDRLVFERQLALCAAAFVPTDVASDDNPGEPPIWLVHLGDTLRASGCAVGHSKIGAPHWLLTSDPKPPQSLPETLDAQRRRAIVEAAAPLAVWPRGTDGAPVATLHVGLAPFGVPMLTVPAADRLQTAGLAEWTKGQATLTPKGRKVLVDYYAILDDADLSQASADRDPPAGA